MPRLFLPAIGLLALALTLGSPGRPALAEDAPAKAKEGAGHGPAAAAPEGGHADAGHGAAEAQPNILEPQVSLAIWTVVVFLGLLAVLGKFAWKPLIEALHRREEHLEHVLIDTERARNESERLLAEHRRQMAEAEERARALLEQARNDAKLAAEEILKKAQTDSEAERARALREIANARDNALSEIWSKTADLAVSVASKVLPKALSPDDHRQLVESAVGELPALTSANGQGGHSA